MLNYWFNEKCLTISVRIVVMVNPHVLSVSAQICEVLMSSFSFLSAGPLRQTFTHNPLKQTPPMAAASPKNKADGGKARPWKDTMG